MVSGTLAVSYLLASSRWGSYIATFGVFVTDILLALGFIAFLLQGRRIGAAKVPVSVLLLLLLVALRGGVSLGQADLALWIRDFAPYGYVSVAVLSALSVTVATEEALRRTWQWLRVAVFIHAAWMLPQIVGTAGPDAVTGYFSIDYSPVAIGQVRPDIDSALLAVAAALSLRSLLLGQAKRPWLVGGFFVLCCFGVLQIYSRAGLLSLILGLSVVSILAIRSATPNRRTALGLAVGAAVLIGAAVVPVTTPGVRLLTTIGLLEDSSAVATSARGTANARLASWDGVLSWTAGEPTRFLFGSGFGNDFLTEARVLGNLEGEEYDNVRSPHNFLVGTLARIGLLGLLAFVIVIGTVARRAHQDSRRRMHDPLWATAVLLVVTILPISLVGVVLEAPFGAVPFWWACGVIIGFGRRPQMARLK